MYMCSKTLFFGGEFDYGRGYDKLTLTEVKLSNNKLFDCSFVFCFIQTEACEITILHHAQTSSGHHLRWIKKPTGQTHVSNGLLFKNSVVSFQALMLFVQNMTAFLYSLVQIFLDMWNQKQTGMLQAG